MQRIDLDPSVGVPANGIVKASLLGRLYDAHAIGQAAQARAEAVVADAHGQAAQIRQHAHRSGYEEGFAAFTQAVARLNSERNTVRRRVTDLVRDSLERFFGALPKEELFGVVLASVLEEISKEQAIAILVHPSNMAMLETAVQVYRARTGYPDPIRCDPDTALSADQCLIYAGPEVVDASIPSMVEEMVNALHGSLGREVSDGC